MDSPRTIGRYEILERIGQRESGVVYTGRDPLLERLVAVEHCASRDDTLKRRFLREGEIAANLHHRNIVTVFELGQDETGPFLAREHLGGEDLEARLRRPEPIPPEVALGYLLQIARALEYAHRKGILHRDLRPANVRVLEDGRVKILDFGIAKISGAETRLSRGDGLPGAAGYLSPEQLQGEPVDARSDVFSFGVLAYELLTGVHPFPGATASEVLRRVVESGLGPIASAWPGCPPEIAALVGRCLELDPERRYPGFAEIAETLGSVLAGLRQGDAPAPPRPEDDAEATQELPPLAFPPARDPRPTRSRRSRRLAVAAGVLLACALAVATAWIGAGRWADRPPRPAQEAGAEAIPGRLAPAQGLLVVDAVPWGEVVLATDGEGRRMPLPLDSSTPLVLEVAPGTYTVELAGPTGLETATCRAEVAAAGTGRCTTEFYRLDPLTYFQDAGWWR